VTAPHTGPALSVSDAQSAASLLQARGLRLSAARRLALEALFAAASPVSAEEIADGLGGRLPRSDLASVYRNLELLEEHGLVRHLHLGHGPGLYAPAGHEREYLLCESCGETRAVDPAELDGVRELIAQRFGHQASFRHFPIVGLCEHCREGRQRR
jgi:Fur family transcriptional regulator, ferric uptake regulator